MSNYEPVDWHNNDLISTDFSIYPTKIDAYKSGWDNGKRHACEAISKILLEFGEESLLRVSSIMAIINCVKDSDI